MYRKILKTLRNILLVIISPILLIGITYLVNPEYIENKALDWFYPTVNIDDKYFNKIVVEVPEVYELMQIACCLTDAYQNNKSQINKGTAYYDEIESNFLHFRNHKLIRKLEKYLKNNLYGSSSHAIRLLSLDYKLNANNDLISTETLNTNQLLLKLFTSEVFLVSENIKLIENFAKEIDFKNFYDNHTIYYSKLKSNFHKLCNFDDIKNWLELKFVNKYQSYRIIISPLTGGFHNTMNFKDNSRNAEISFMFVSAPRYNLEGLSKNEYEIISSQRTRSVFTEIDHNYVNPLTDNYLKELNSAVPDYKYWNTQENKRVNYYNSNYMTFNEYMTWAVFSLYAIDTYSNQNIDTILTIQENKMHTNRKFIHFGEFNDELIKQYKINSKPLIDSLYNNMLEWMKNKYLSKKTKI